MMLSSNLLDVPEIEQSFQTLNSTISREALLLDQQLGLVGNNLQVTKRTSTILRKDEQGKTSNNTSHQKMEN